MYNSSGGKNDSVNRGCRDMSGVIGPFLDGAEVGNAGRIVNDELRILMSHFPTSFTLVYGCLKSTPKTAISASLGDLWRACLTARLARQHVAVS
jgi:hypothetical protein